MDRRVPGVLSSLWGYVVPQYRAWVLANITLYGVVLWQLREVTVVSGQGGWGFVYVWPDYWVRYGIQDIAFPVIPEFTWDGLVANYLRGLLPFFVAFTVLLNATRFEFQWLQCPNFSKRDVEWRVLGLVVLHVPLAIFALPGILFWVMLVSIVSGAVVCSVRSAYRG